MKNTEAVLTELNLPELIVPKCTFHLSHKEQLLLAFRTMDIEAFEKLLSEDQTFYDDKNKWQFLAELKKEFDEFKNSGDTELMESSGICRGCHWNMKGFRFTGNRSGKNIDYVFAEKEDDVMDLVGCSLFQSEHDKPFYTLCGLVERAKQLGIKYDCITDLLPEKERSEYSE